MALLNINELSGDDLRQVASAVKGISTEDVDRLLDYVCSVPAVASSRELVDRLTLLGVDAEAAGRLAGLFVFEPPEGIDPFFPLIDPEDDLDASFANDRQPLSGLAPPDDGDTHDRYPPPKRGHQDPYYKPGHHDPHDKPSYGDPHDKPGYGDPYGEPGRGNPPGEDPLPRGEPDPPAPPLKPLVFVHGILGSELMVVNNRGTPRQEGRILFPPGNVANLEPGRLDDFLDALNQGRLETSGNLTLDAYSQLLTNLRLIGYAESLGNLLVFAYNWTQSNEISGAELAQEIRRFLARYNAVPGQQAETVDVICHSMGGLVTRVAIDFEEAPIDRVVYIGTPHNGAVKALAALHPALTGSLFSFYDELAFDLFQSFKDDRNQFGTRRFRDLSKLLAALTVSCTSVYELLPDDAYIRKVVMVQRFQSRRVGNIYTPIKDPEKVYFNGPASFPGSFHDKIRKALDFKRRLTPTIPNPGRHHLIVNTFTDTIDQVHYRTGATITGATAFSVESSKQQGDGTVPSFSALGLPPQFNQPSSFENILGVPHAQLPNSPVAFASIRQFLGI